MVNGMITLHNNDDMRPRRNMVKIKTKNQWELWCSPAPGAGLT